MSDWISVKDKWPKAHEPVLVWNGMFVCFATKLPHEKAFVECSRFFEEQKPIKKATHWMPLPEPPK